MSSRTCPACGARNSAAAAWCTQCFESLEDPAGPAAHERESTHPRPTEASGAPVAADPERAAQGAGTPTAPIGPRTGTGGRGTAGRDVRETAEGEVEWRCATCATWSPLEAPACVACGTARHGFGTQAEAAASAPVDEDRLVACSLLLPGLGHLLAGRVGTGLARMLFAVGWLVGGVLLLIAAVRAGAAHLASVPLLLGAVVVWVLTVLDIRSLARGEHRERLDGRTLLWLMAGVTGVLVLALMLDTWRLAG